jgi:Calponin homology (CH) domain
MQSDLSDDVISHNSVGIKKLSADKMDIMRKNTHVKDYLCKLDEAKVWVHSFTNTTEDLQTFLLELQKGEMLAVIAQRFDPDLVKRIHISKDKEYLHTDNIFLFLQWLKKIKLPKHFFFETIDLYENKNITKVIYCIHGLAHYLKGKGIYKGIEKNPNQKFTKEEEDMIADEAHKMSSFKFDNIQNKIDEQQESSSQDNYNFQTILNNLDQTISANQAATAGLNADKNAEYIKDDQGDCRRDTSYFEDDCTADLKTFAKTFVWRKSFQNILFDGAVSVPSLRRFICLGCQGPPRSKELEELHSNIAEKFKSNYLVQVERDDILRTVRLLLENQSRLRNIPFVGYPLANDYKLFKRAIYYLLHDYALIHRILSDSYDLPLRILFPDSAMGDYNFSLFTRASQSYSFSKIETIARKHFMSSKVYNSIINIFKSEYNFDLNPIRIYESLYKNTKSILLDEAIMDQGVRDEIVKRSNNIISFMNQRMDYLLSMDLPYYVRMFVDDPGFFECFIEPAILKSENLVICELFKYIFNSHSQHDSFNFINYSSQTSFNSKAKITPTASIPQQERMLYTDSQINVVSDFDFSDYSPLKEYLDGLLDSEYSFHCRFNRKHRINCSISDYFLEITHESLEIQVSIRDVNNLTMVLKENIGKMNKNMQKIVNSLSLIGSKKGDNGKSVVISDLKYTPVNITVNDQLLPNEHDKQCIPREEGDNNRAIDNHQENVKSVDNKTLEKKLRKNRLYQDNFGNESLSKEDEMLMQEKFILKLDSQFIETLDEDEIALEAVVNDIKSRIALLLSISNSNDLNSILYVTTNEEVDLFSSYCDMKLEEFKKKTIADLEFLISKKFIGSFSDILELIAKDIIGHKYKGDNELLMNQETSDALFQKGIALKNTLGSLYSYLNSLFKSMVSNKSGKIMNRQSLPKSLYGTYGYPLSEVDAHVYEPMDGLSFLISSEKPLEFTINILCNGESICSPFHIGFNHLLRLREEGVETHDICGICSFKVNSLIDLINQQYINY